MSAGQSALDNVLLKALGNNFSDMDAANVVKTGATNLRAAFTSDQMQDILTAYMKGLRAAFLVAIVASSLATVVSMGSRWRKLSNTSAPAVA